MIIINSSYGENHNREVYTQMLKSGEQARHYNYIKPLVWGYYSPTNDQLIDISIDHLPYQRKIYILLVYNLRMTEGKSRNYKFICTCDRLRKIIQTKFEFPKRLSLYAVKAQTSLAPLSRFRGSHITAHEQQCCRFQSYAKAVPSPMKLTSEIDKAWTTFLGSTTTDHLITACDVWL